MLPGPLCCRLWPYSLPEPVQNVANLTQSHASGKEAVGKCSGTELVLASRKHPVPRAIQLGIFGGPKH